ncbi:MAG: ATP-binding protein [Candidatus Desulfaltia sp.]|nr:ATP-binding protein [Candidatus Desulfaltia sp.]
MEKQLRQSQKLEAIGTLAGGIAHDFNNLLTIIIGNAQLALMNVIKDESLRKQMGEIKKAGNKAASLTRQLLAFSRRQIIKPQVLDLNEEIKEMEKMLKRTIGEDIEFQTILGHELWKVYADSGQINHVIINMVVNARDAISACADSEAGRPQGGKLTVKTANAYLDENYFSDRGIKEMPGPYVMLAVSDTGIGMDKEIREHIFEPFFTTKDVDKGTGLGLSTVYGIVKQNKGFIWVYSEPGQGSTFSVYLPKMNVDTEPEEKEQTFVDELCGSETVLIVEDDEGLLKLVQNVLQGCGYRVLSAENGEKALRVGKEHEGQIDLMITDVVMPKMGGREAADRLQPLYPQMKVLYMSGYTDNAIVHHGVLESGLNFLEKPFTPECLARKVREVLDKEQRK